MASKAIREKLVALVAGSRVRRDGKVYRVLAVRRDEGKALCRTDVALLEEGLPESYERPGILLAAGRTIRLSNVQNLTWYAQRPYDFELVA